MQISATEVLVIARAVPVPLQHPLKHLTAVTVILTQEAITFSLTAIILFPTAHFHQAVLHLLAHHLGFRLVHRHAARTHLSPVLTAWEVIRSEAKHTTRRVLLVRVAVAWEVHFKEVVVVLAAMVEAFTLVVADEKTFSPRKGYYTPPYFF